MEPVLLDSDAAINDMALRCAEVWRAALSYYWRDAKSAWRGNAPDDGEALSDLLGDQRLLRHLCSMADADADVMADTMLTALDRVSSIAA